MNMYKVSVYLNKFEQYIDTIVLTEFEHEAIRKVMHGYSKNHVVVTFITVEKMEVL